jgi:hypothetical protein
VNVGLEISSGEAATNPLMTPLASVVFPAPKFPINRTQHFFGSVAEIVLPS